MGSGVVWNYTLETAGGSQLEGIYTYTHSDWYKAIISFFYIELRQKVCISLLIEKARIKECQGEDSFAYNKNMFIMLYYLFNHIPLCPKGTFIWCDQYPAICKGGCVPCTLTCAH